MTFDPYRRDVTEITTKTERSRLCNSSSALFVAPGITKKRTHNATHVFAGNGA